MFEMIRWSRSSCMVFLLVILTTVLLSRADQVEYTTYYFKDNHENTVATSAFSLAKTLWQKTQILLDVELDQITVPPYLDQRTGVDGISSASRPQRQSKSDFIKNRGQIISGVEQGLGANTKLSGSYYFSKEVDYASQSIIGGLTQEFLHKNHTWTLRAQYSLDSVGEILDNGAVLNQFKETHQASILISQLLSPTSILRVGVDGMRNHGFLSDPYRKLDHHPSLRYRQAAWAEISQFLRAVDGSFIITYRYYWDDWELKSNTLSLKLNKYITPNWILSPEYRYYDQTGASFGQYAKDQPNLYFTSDYKLRAFTSHTVGMGATCFLRAFGKNHPDWDFLTNTSVSLLYFHYFNDTDADNFTANILETRIKFAF
jgi:Protein of unknown function (DUF3570)